MSPLREELAHVLWLGGSACAGKSTAARSLAAAHGLTLYSCDDRFEEHRRRASPELHPGFHRLMDLSPEELWTRPVAMQVQDLLRFYEDEFTLIVEDLRSLPGPVLAEGVGLLPARVAEVLAEPRHACWLIATPAFRRRQYPRRPWLDELLGRCPDPRQAFADWMARDDEIADYLEAGAASLGLAVHTIDGAGTEEETVAMLERLFGLGGSP